MSKIYYHLPGLFEFAEFYRAFLPIYYKNRDWFYDFAEISSIYGSPADCLWGGGRVGFGENNPREVLALADEYGISPRLTFSNSLLEKEHLNDRNCNRLLEIFSKSRVKSGVIITSDLLLGYIKTSYPDLYFVSSTTKCQTAFADFKKELGREDFAYVVPDFRLNKAFDGLKTLTDVEKSKVELLCNECCPITCTERKACYEAVSRKNLGENVEHICKNTSHGYRFSEAMKNPSFIGIEDINKIYAPMGIRNFKIEGRSLGSALLLEFILYYLTKPTAHLPLREELYLNSSLDLF